MAHTLPAAADGDATDLVPNPGFEADDPLDGWWFGMHLGSGSCRVSQERPYEGARADGGVTGAALPPAQAGSPQSHD